MDQILATDFVLKACDKFDIYSIGSVETCSALGRASMCATISAELHIFRI